MTTLWYRLLAGPKLCNMRAEGRTIQDIRGPNPLLATTSLPTTAPHGQVLFCALLATRVSTPVAYSWGKSPTNAAFTKGLETPQAISQASPFRDYACCDFGHRAGRLSARAVRRSTSRTTVCGSARGELVGARSARGARYQRQEACLRLATPHPPGAHPSPTTR